MKVEISVPEVVSIFKEIQQKPAVARKNCTVA